MRHTECSSPTLRPAPSSDALAAIYRRIRDESVLLCSPLALEDYVIQAMPEVSPPKWHLAHTSWFFEQFVLVPYVPGYRPFHPTYGHLFNSYYETAGTPFPRPQRGLLARPTVEEVYRYRTHVDGAMAELLAAPPESAWQSVAARTWLGLHHEQQHQELLLTDIKYNFSVNPLRPVYRPLAPAERRAAPPLGWRDYPGGIRDIGHGGDGFAYDNETPRHPVLLRPYRLATRLTTVGEFLEFIEADGYRRPELWLADGWATARQRGWEAPLYWERIDGAWWHMTLGGLRPLDEHEPVCHVSFYEADAYARWRGRRLPSEAEWESAAAGQPILGNCRDTGRYHPAVADPPRNGAPSQLFGDVWEWTQSPYAPYPGFKPLAGSLGEYNGKFMCNQMVLRGGSCATPRAHLRATYRNFFYPADRWQFSGIRLAEDLA
ncbi:ergothioneine biosynthesis protein EgtB [Candidatus Methylocalor cossyra]|uniref:Ergothioneine biosynthesis protein EgtB n=1 Tax=Candidatus Methylocalor cossyra TaxID=3108543 RepID=A0ABP1C9I6_9GAMM